MCGIVGVLNQDGEPVPTVLLQRMIGTITHRGPDGQGVYTDGAIGLAHARLAIIDLTAAAHQPMMTADKRYVITYNGEIYNFLELRVELENLGVFFNSRSDTEVVLHAFAHWGVAAFSKFNGMFALAIWDRVEKQVFLARDRYGIKPLYWYHENGLIVFASEIKAILKHEAIRAQVCFSALSEYFTFQNIFSSKTLFKNIQLLPAGSIMILSECQTAAPKLHSYWDYDFSTTDNLSKGAGQEELYQLFTQAVTRQLVADVPVGSYLSGGIDSGSITAIAARQIPRLTTFTCGFDLSSASGMELSFDERVYSELMSNAFKTEHYEVVLHAGDMEHILPKLIWHLEDLRVGQCYPNFYVARLASKFVKVALSGAGGDELFAGYPWRYFKEPSSQGTSDYYSDYYQFWQRLVPDEHKAKFFNKNCLDQSQNTFEVFKSVFQPWQRTLNSKEDQINASMYFELKTFLAGLLIVEDKLSMANSLETRLPFLDNDLVDFALKIPLGMKLSHMDKQVLLDENIPYKRVLQQHQEVEGKVILRDTMSRLLPEAIVSKRKQGFSAPDASWFRGESIDYINRVLRSPKALLYEFISRKYVHTVLDEHCSGKVNHRLLIWSLLSFEWWCKLFLEQSAATFCDFQIQEVGYIL